MCLFFLTPRVCMCQWGMVGSCRGLRGMCREDTEHLKKKEKKKEKNERSISLSVSFVFVCLVLSLRLNSSKPFVLFCCSYGETREAFESETPRSVTLAKRTRPKRRKEMRKKKEGKDSACSSFTCSSVIVCPLQARLAARDRNREVTRCKDLKRKEER